MWVSLQQQRYQHNILTSTTESSTTGRHHNLTRPRELSFTMSSKRLKRQAAAKDNDPRVVKNEDDDLDLHHHQHHQARSTTITRNEGLTEVDKDLNISILLDKIKTLQTSLKVANEKNEELEASLKTSTQEIDNLNEYLNETRQEKHSFKTDLDEVKQQNDTLKADLDEVKQENMMLQNQKANIVTDLITAQRREVAYNKAFDNISHERSFLVCKMEEKELSDDVWRAKCAVKDAETEAIRITMQNGLMDRGRVEKPVVVLTLLWKRSQELRTS